MLDYTSMTDTSQTHQFAQECSVCKDPEANYFCRLCSSYYCPDCLCIHLSVAWENNSWTSRNAGKNQEVTSFNFGLNTQEEEKNETNVHEPCERTAVKAIHTAPTTTTQSAQRSILSYSTEELQNKLEFYHAQTRRIRVELERRALPSAGFAFGEEKQLFPRSKRKHGIARSASFSPKIPAKLKHLLSCFQGSDKERLVEFLKAQALKSPD